MRERCEARSSLMQQENTKREITRSRALWRNAQGIDRLNAMKRARSGRCENAEVAFRQNARPVLTFSALAIRRFLPFDATREARRAYLPSRQLERHLARNGVAN